MNARDPFSTQLALGLLADSSIKTYNKVWKNWLLECDTFGKSALPIIEEEFEEWLQTELDHLSYSAFEKRTAVAQASHKYNDLPRLRFSNQLAIMRQTIRKRGTPIIQATPIRLDQVLTICEAPKISLRTRAMVSIMFDAVLRSYDCLNLKWDQIKIIEKNDTTRAYLNLIKTKGKIIPQGHLRSLSVRTMGLLTHYYEQLTEGYQKPTDERIFPYAYETMVKQFKWIREDLNIHLTTHSMRVGAACEMYEAGIGELYIMQNGGWSTLNMVQRYTRNAAPQNDGMSQLFGKKREPKQLESIPRFMEHFGEHIEK